MTVERNIQVSKDIAEKIRLENIFKPEIRSIFNAIKNEFVIVVANTGRPQNVSKFRDTWVVALKKHYERVQKKFTISIKDETKNIGKDKNEDAFFLALLNWKDENARITAGLITETTNNNMLDSIDIAKQQLNQNNQQINNRTVAILATTLLRRKFLNRAESIAISETQNAAESTKNITGLFVDKILKEGNRISLPIEGATKSWHTVGDDRVRPAHVVAGITEQNKPINSPFLVGGELLMFPRDISLGASIDNVINCRCSSVISVLGKIINFHK